jgi:hypothetical protein
MELEKELNDREFQAFAKQYKCPKWAQTKIKKYFALTSDNSEGEQFQCRHCGRHFSVVEVFTIIDPEILLEHSVPGLPEVRAPFGSGRFWVNQCAVKEEIQ